MSKLKTILAFVKNNQRYFWAIGVLIVFFAINKAFSADIITSEDCAGGNCEKMLLEPQLSDAEMKFYRNDVFSSQSGEFYRLIFQTEANQDSEIEVFATNPLDEDKFIGSFALEKDKGKKFQEAVFLADKNYTDFLFTKKNPDGAEIFLKNIKTSPLNIFNEKELAELKPTIFGNMKIKDVSQEQTDNDFLFKQLLEPKVLLGQVFQAKSDFLAEIEMDIDVVKQGEGNGDRYAFDLREAEFDGVTSRVTSRRISTLKFNAQTIEQYRQLNGKFRFPILAPVKNGEFYFFGLDNDGVEVNQFNYLAPRGSKDNTRYLDGDVAVKFKGDSFPSQGDLYFKIFGADFEEFEGKKVLLGSTIEDLGGGKMFFSYQPDESRYGFSDFADATFDIGFDGKENSITGEIVPEKESFFSYKFETLEPFKTFRLFGESFKPNLNNLKMAYSFDKEKWTEIPEKIIAQESGITSQAFDFSQTEKVSRDLIYVKIYPQTDYPAGTLAPIEYGIRNFRFEADLISK